MKKFYFLFLFALIASIGNLYAAEKTVTSTFKDKDLTVGVGEPGWVASITANSFESNNNNRGVQFGAAKGAFTLKTSESFSQVKKVSVILSTNEKVNTVSLKVGGTSVDGMKTLSKRNNYAVNWSVVSPQDGIIEFSFNDKKGSIYIKSISITYEFVETKCAKPTFNLTEGAVYGEAKVLEITSDKVGAQIEYTVIGGGNISITKTEASPVKVTLNQNGDYTVEAFALGMDDYAKSDAAGLNFRIELAAGVPTFSVEEGTFTEAQTITLTPGEGGEKVFYTINDGTEQQYIEPIKLEEEGIYKIAAYTAATETLAKSASVTKTYIINFPLDEPYILCENAAWLTEGTKIIFVGEKNNKYYGLSGDADGVFLTGGLVTISAKELTEKDVTVKVFVVGRTANGVTFNTDAGYLAADKTASKGNLSYAAGNEGDCFHWTVSVANGEATVVNADVTGDCNNLQFNPSAKTPRFGAYADSYKNGNLSIYLLGSTSSVSSMSAEGVKVFAAEGGVKVMAEEATDVAVYTVAGQLVRQARVAEGSTLVNVAPGFYVVRANGTATKVIVR